MAAEEIPTMKTLLIINSSPRSNSVSRKLTGEFAAQWTTANPEGRISERNLADGSIPYLSEPWIEAAYTPERAETPSGRCSRCLTH
jgi:FMN-dependent NADH-azoreductase